MSELRGMKDRMGDLESTIAVQQQQLISMETISLEAVHEGDIPYQYSYRHLL